MLHTCINMLSMHAMDQRRPPAFTCNYCIDSDRVTPLRADLYTECLVLNGEHRKVNYIFCF